jgi:hypothetical protein
MWWAQEVEVNNSKKAMRLLNTSGGEVVYENTVADGTYVVSSAKLCQEGIEQVQGVHERRTRP